MPNWSNQVLRDYIGSAVHFFADIFSAVSAEPWRSAFASAIGLFVGAWITSRANRKRLAREELNAVTAAIALSFSICNRFLGMKRQFVRPWHEEYEALQRRHSALQDTKLILPSGTTFKFQANLQTISPTKTPIDALEKILFERVSMRGRGIVAAADLSGAIDGLKQSIEARNQLTQEFKELTEEKVPSLYLGLPDDRGHIDSRFKDNLAALVAQTDDCIFFSKTLGEDLVKYGKGLRRKQAQRLQSLGLPKMQSTDWTMAEKAKLLPAEDMFTDWLRGFKSKPSFPQRIWILIRRPFVHHPPDKQP